MCVLSVISESPVKMLFIYMYIHLDLPEMVASKKEIQKLKKYTITKSESKKKQYAL